jgi:hypothetical protein
MSDQTIVRCAVPDCDWGFGISTIQDCEIPAHLLGHTSPFRLTILVSLQVNPASLFTVEASISITLTFHSRIPESSRALSCGMKCKPFASLATATSPLILNSACQSTASLSVCFALSLLSASLNSAANAPVVGLGIGVHSVAMQDTMSAVGEDDGLYISAPPGLLSGGFWLFPQSSDSYTIGCEKLPGGRPVSGGWNGTRMCLPIFAKPLSQVRTHGALCRCVGGAHGRGEDRPGETTVGQVGLYPRPF